MSESTERPNLFFRLTTFAGAVFVITILSLVASVFGDPQAPPARFLNAHGTTLILWQVGVILVLGLVAMAVDRRQMLRRMRDGQADSPPVTRTLEASRSLDQSGLEDHGRHVVVRHAGPDESQDSLVQRAHDVDGRA